MRTKKTQLMFAMALVLAVTAVAGIPGWQEEFGTRMAEAVASASAKPQLSKAHPEATLAEAYAIQAAFVKKLLADGAVGGFKAAIVNAEAQTAMGLDGPLTGVIPADGVLHAREDTSIDLAAEPSRMLETEIGYIFGQGISSEIPDVDTLKKHVKSVVPIIEVPGGTSENEPPVTAGDLVARNIDAMGVILGHKQEPQALDVDAVEITFTHNGTVVNTAKGAGAAGGQWETLRKTVNALVAQGYAIEAGQFITNGALGQIVPALPGAYCADYGPLGKICCTVVDSRPAN